MTIHTKIKPYLCENCNQTFSCVGNLIKHRKLRLDTCGLPKFTNKKIFKQNNTSSEILKSEKEASQNITQQNEIEETQEVSTENFIVEKVDLETPESDFLIQEVHVEELDLIDADLKIISNNEMNSQEVEEELIMKEEHLDDNEIYFESIDGNIEINEDIDTKNENEDIDKYIEINNDQQYCCKLCPKIYQKKNISMKHLINEHQIELENFVFQQSNRYRKSQKPHAFSCKNEFCKKKFTSPKLAEKHEINHGKEGNLVFKCSCCRLYFQTQSEVESHQNEVHEDRLKCSIDDCLRQFNSPEQLLSHKKYAHSSKSVTKKKYLFKCTLCGRSCY